MQTKSERVNLSRANSVMAAIESYAHCRESYMLRYVSDNLFNECFNDLIVNLYGARNVFRMRPPETTYATLLERVCVKRKQEFGDRKQYN